MIDAHYHLRSRKEGEFALPRVRGETAKELIEIMDKEGVDIAVCMPVPSPKQTVDEIARRDNDFVASEVKKFPKRLVGLCISSPFGVDGGTKEFERAVRELGMKGIKLHPDLTGRNTLDLLTPIFKKAEELGVPISIHSIDPELGPDRIGFLSRNFPNVAVIMAHMGGGGSYATNYRLAIEQAQANKNIILETSGFYYHPDAIKRAVKAIGADRIAWGSDGPFLSVDLSWSKSMLQQAGLSEDEQNAILGGNMARVLKI